MNRASCGPFVVRVTVKQQKKLSRAFFFLYDILLCSVVSLPICASYTEVNGKQVSSKLPLASLQKYIEMCK